MSGGRESSKGFFSRNKHHKVSAPRPTDPYPEDPPSSKNPAKSIRSHYSRNSISSTPQYRETIYDELPLNNTAGVVTSIPYDSVAPDLNRQPIPVDYARPVSRGDDGREITPHSIARMGGGDFHQYPSVDGQNQYYSHPTGPRPPPGSSGSSTQGGVSHYTPYAPSSSSRNTNGSQMYYPSNSTASSNTRSSDQLSVYSSVSSITRGSILSITPTAADVMPQPSQFGNMTEFSMERPKDDRVVENMFLELMHKRGYTNIPEPSKRQLMAKPVAGKWVMIYQDKLADFQAEQKRRAGGLGSGKDLDEDSPQWYVKKIMEGNITAKQLGSLSVSLRTQPIG